MMEELRRGIAIMSLAMFAGCAGPAEREGEAPVGEDGGANSVVVLGAITWSEHSQAEEAPLDIEVPGQVITGEPFEVWITTYGQAPECTEPSHAEIEPHEAALRITPYDRWFDYDCFHDIWAYEHRVEVVLEEPGEHLLEVRGAASPPELGLEPEFLTAEYVVTAEE